AAGAGPGSGPARKRTVDYGGAVKLIEAARMNEISRYLMVSAMGVRDAGARGEEMRPYYEAKLEADRALIASGLDYTIVRPGRLTDDPGTGRIEIDEQLARVGEAPRALVVAACRALVEVVDRGRRIARRSGSGGRTRNRRRGPTGDARGARAAGCRLRSRAACRAPVSPGLGVGPPATAGL